jgi:maleate cis-trans isomerase
MRSSLRFAGTRTLELIAPLEKRGSVPVVSARPHAFWAGVRLLGLTGTVQGFGTVLAKG